MCVCVSASSARTVLSVWQMIIFLFSFGDYSVLKSHRISLAGEKNKSLITCFKIVVRGAGSVGAFSERIGFFLLL